MRSRIVRLLKRKNETSNPPRAVSSNALDDVDSALRGIVNVDKAREALKPLMIKAQIPDDVIDLLTKTGTDPLDLDKHQQLLYSCYGRLEHLQNTGRCAAAIITKQLESNGISAPSQSLPNVDELALEGVIPVNNLLTPTQITEAMEWFKVRPCFNGHTPDAASDRVVHRFVGQTANEHAFGSYTTLDVMSAPHLLEAIFSEQLLGSAVKHLGCVPTLSAFQAWWNFPGHDKNVVPGGYAPCFYHRDLNDLRMFWVYMYLTDVEDNSGPHMVIKKSSDADVIARHLEKAATEFPTLRQKLQNIAPSDFFYQYGYHLPRDIIDNIFKDLEVSFSGKAGTTFFSNGFNYHRIKYPVMKRRLMFAARFSINPSINTSPSRDGDRIPGDIISSRIGDSPLIQYITRRLVDFSPRQI